MSGQHRNVPRRSKRHFKMAIELNSVNAEVYANLRHQADEDAKAMRAAMNR